MSPHELTPAENLMVDDNVKQRGDRNRRLLMSDCGAMNVLLMLEHLAKLQRSITRKW